MSLNSIRTVVEELAVVADIEIHRSDGQRADSGEMHPHALGHSLASFKLRDEDTRLVDVRNRLRHRSISTTERVYEHFQRR
jgi:integrase/recombinase XerC/integrase/recombinase XerD